MTLSADLERAISRELAVRHDKLFYDALRVVAARFAEADWADLSDSIRALSRSLGYKDEDEACRAYRNYLNQPDQSSPKSG